METQLRSLGAPVIMIALFLISIAMFAALTTDHRTTPVPVREIVTRDQHAPSAR